MSDTPPEELEDLPANTALAARFGSFREARENGLVILAMNLPYWYVEDAGGHALYVESERLGVVAQELTAFREEQSDWHPHQADHGFPDRPASFYVPYAATLVLTASFILQNAYAPGYAATGRMDAVGLFDRGEWWRPLTAMFLHGDGAHLLGNLVFGLWYGTLVNRGYGTLLGWCLILLAGVLGNTAVGAWHYPDPHYSLGASTAVFGALGLLVAEGLTHQWQQRFMLRWGPLLVPLVAGGVLLGWTGGFDNPQTDGMAHVMGFLAGVILGMFSLPRLVHKKRT